MKNLFSRKAAKAQSRRHRGEFRDSPRCRSHLCGFAALRLGGLAAWRET